jgi:hypothetical protein
LAGSPPIFWKLILRVFMSISSMILPKASGSGGHPEHFPCGYADEVGDQHQRLLG